VPRNPLNHVIGRPPTSIAQRFWPKVDKENGYIHPVHGRCWEWTAKLGPGGYGVIKIPVPGAPGGHCNRGAHKISWVLANGAVPDGLFVLHKCDNRKCVRLEHLFLGTTQENALDAKSKGRLARLKGESNGMASLTEAKAYEIKRRALAGESPTALGREFDIVPSAVCNIKKGRRWAHL